MPRFTRSAPGARTVAAAGLAMLAAGCSAGPTARPPAAAGPPARLERYLAGSRAEHDHSVVRGVGPVATHPAAVFRFTDPAQLEGFRVIEGEWAIADGRLTAVGGRPDRNRTILLMPVDAAHLRVSFEAILEPRADGRIGDICIRLANPETGSFAAGYAVITAQFWNQATVVYRRNIPIARTEWSPIVPGRTHRVTLEFSRGRRDHLRLWVDDRVVLDGWHEPLDIRNAWLGFSSYDTRLSIANLVVYTGPPAPPD